MFPDQADQAPTPPPQIIALGPSLLLQGTVIPSFAQFAMTGEDNVLVTVNGSIAGATVNVQGRFLDATSGKVLPFSWPITVPSNRIPATQSFALGTGYLLNLTAFSASGGAARYGQVYVDIDVQRGLSGGTFLLGTLISGYVTDTISQGFPGSPIGNPVDSGGIYRTVIGTTPAAGAEINEIVPTNARWQLIAANFSLTCSAIAGSRHTRVLSKQPAAQPFLSWCSVTLTANQTGTYSMSALGNQFTISESASVVLSAIPLTLGLFLNAGDGWVTNTLGLLGGDQYSAPNYLVREWLEF